MKTWQRLIACILVLELCSRMFIIPTFAQSESFENNRRYITAIGSGISLLNEQITFPVSVSQNAYVLKDEQRNIVVYDAGHSYYEKTSPITESTNTNWNNHKEAITVFSNIIKIYDYYASVFGRDGANNNHEEINIYVNYRFSNPSYLDAYGQYSNAFYSDNITGRTVLAVGDGNDIAKALDVLAHEYTHAVTKYTWNPIYYGESGALDEAYADIIAELIENGNLSVIGNNLSRGAVRNFADPSNPSDKTQIKQASHYNNRYVGTDDYGGVHINSGIINHAAYLMDKNWTTPNHSTELATLFYKSMSYMSPNAQFIDCKNALIAAAVEMNLGDEKIAVIVNAFESVGIN